MKVVVSTVVEADAVRAVNIYNGKPGRYGPVVTDEIAKAYDRIGENPRLFSPFEYGPPGTELRVYHIRRFDLIDLFEVLKHEVVIQSVVHANRPPEKWITRAEPTPPT
jgi:hypothetical protein